MNKLPKEEIIINPLKEFKRKINIGLGDLIFAKKMLDNVRDKYKKIIIVPNHSNKWRQSRGTKNVDNLWEYTKKVIKLLFDNDPLYEIDWETGRGIVRATWDFWTEDGILPIVPYLPQYFCKPEMTFDFNPEEYIVLHTRARNVDHSDIDITKTFELLKGKKLIVMGETKFWPAIGVKGFCIYDELIHFFGRPGTKGIKNIRFMLTNLDKPDIDILFRDSTIMSRAKATIAIGNGGNHVLTTAVTKNCICYRGNSWKKDVSTRHLENFLWGDHHDDKQGLLVTTNYDAFLARIKTL